MGGHRVAILGAVFCALASNASAATIYSQTQSGSVGFPDSTPVVLTFTDALPAISDATLTLVATGGELNLANKRLENLLVDGVAYETPGTNPGWMLPTNQFDAGGVLPPPVTIPLVDLNSYVADGMVQVSVVRPGFLAGGSFDITLEYTTSVPEPSSIAILSAAVLGGFLYRKRRV